MDQNLSQSNLRYIRLSGKWTKTWFKANREVLWGRTFGKFCNDCGERGKHRNTLKYCYGSSILNKTEGTQRKGKPVHFFLFTVGAAAVSAPDSRALPAGSAVRAPRFVPPTPISGVIAGYEQRSQPARLTRHTCCPAFLVTATVPRGAPSRRCTLAASSQTSSSAERSPAHTGELVRLAHHYRHIVGPPPSLRPLGKRCRLVSLIFCPFFSLGRC